MTRKSKPKWTKEQKEAIEHALRATLIACGACYEAAYIGDKKAIDECLEHARECQNALYDAIGGMDEYKVYKAVIC